MADAVTTRVLFNEGQHYSAVFTNASDGTGESAVVKVDKSALVDARGVEPDKLRIMKAEWSIQGIPRVIIAFDHNTDDTVLVLGAGTGKMCFEKQGGLVDPASAGGTGDILFTVAAGATTGSYTIKLDIRK